MFAFLPVCLLSVCLFSYRPPGLSYTAPEPQKQPTMLKKYFLETIIKTNSPFIFPLKELYSPFKALKGPYALSHQAAGRRPLWAAVRPPASIDRNLAPKVPNPQNPPE